MGRRSKAELEGITGDIVTMHDRDRMTHREIADELQRRGKDLSDEAVRRSYNSARRKAEKYKLAAESSKAVLESVADGTNTDLVEAANSILINMFYEKILDMEDLEFEKPADFFKAMGTIAKNQVELSKHRLNFQNGVEKAKNAVYEALAESLTEHPDLLEELKRTIAGLEVKE